MLEMTSGQTTTVELLHRFSDLIADGTLSRGSRLPSERELATQFGVSRSSLRHVMKLLEGVGVISQRVGDGSYLSVDASQILNVPFTFVILLDGISLLELFDARLIIEPELAARAAERAPHETLDSIRGTLSRMLVDTAEADTAFHQAVCKAAGNRVAQRMFEALQDALRNSMQVTTQLAPPERALEFHTAVYSAIHLRNPALAREKMTEHLNDAQRVLLSACLEGKLSKQLKWMTASAKDVQSDIRFCNSSRFLSPGRCCSIILLPLAQSSTAATRDRPHRFARRSRRDPRSAPSSSSHRRSGTATCPS
jgi:GntR family transcriptional repressor for pyruvate dehydrogenase complex